MAALAGLGLGHDARWMPRAATLMFCADHADISGDGSWASAVGCAGDHVVIDTRPGTFPSPGTAS